MNAMIHYNGSQTGGNLTNKENVLNYSFPNLKHFVS